MCGKVPPKPVENKWKTEESVASGQAGRRQTQMTAKAERKAWGASRQKASGRKKRESPRATWKDWEGQAECMGGGVSDAGR